MESPQRGNTKMTILDDLQGIAGLTRGRIRVQKMENLDDVIYGLTPKKPLTHLWLSCADLLDKFKMGLSLRSSLQKLSLEEDLLFKSVGKTEGGCPGCPGVLIGVPGVMGSSPGRGSWLPGGVPGVCSFCCSTKVFCPSRILQTQEFHYGWYVRT